ncbi:MAG: aspartate--tRNA ligase [Planctomycetota bacterium]|nr:aspartate--tRNA ligase [Planctomycetota bacterium]
MPLAHSNHYRTHTCGELRESDIGKSVRLSGWVHTNRDMGGVVFVDLRDKYGMTQIVFDPRRSGAIHDEAAKLRGEWVIRVEGIVKGRPEGTRNNKLPTGAVEVEVTDIQILNRAQTPPIEIRDDLTANEDIRLQYRYLDLRRNPMQKILTTRHLAAQTARNYMSSQGFVEVETPFMVKYTPGGARNFLVPSRLNKGKFYALAESPQLFKQLLMVAGTDRYYQIVRCFRDEDLRIDRQPEFTQVDIEMSFIEQEDLFVVVEGLVAALLQTCTGVELKLPLDRMPFEEAMRRFGNDKPDRRLGLEHVELTEIVKKHGGGGMKLMKTAVDGGGLVKGLRVPAQYELPRSQIDKLEELAKGMGAKGLAWAKVDAQGNWAQSPLAKVISPEMRTEMTQACGSKPGDTLFFQFGRAALVQTVMANLRVHLGKKFGMIPEYGAGGTWDCFWVVNPPLFEYDDEAKAWVTAHHAFTRPQPQCLEALEKGTGDNSLQSPLKDVLCYRYDLVLNGYEIAGGSIRIHDQETQKKVFRAMGISEAEAQEKFGFLLDAFQYGAPPHGGIALGWDRLVWLLTEAPTMRDVFAFPKNQKGVDMMTGAPNVVAEQQLRELAIRVIEEEVNPAPKKG